VSDLQDLIHTNAHNAYEIGVRTERERIVSLLEARVAKLDAMRPESYKSVAELADLRIVTYRNIIKFIKEETE
jgi:hypothetical protein